MKNRWWELHQIYNFGAVGEKDELIRVWGQKVKSQGHMWDHTWSNKHIGEHFLTCLRKACSCKYWWHSGGASDLRSGGHGLSSQVGTAVLQPSCKLFVALFLSQSSIVWYWEGDGSWWSPISVIAGLSSSEVPSVVDGRPCLFLQLPSPSQYQTIIIIIMMMMTFIPRILASASNAPKQAHCQTGKSSCLQKAAKESVERKLTGRLSGRIQQNFCHNNLSVTVSVTMLLCNRNKATNNLHEDCNIQFLVWDIYLGMWPATQVNSAWPSLCA